MKVKPPPIRFYRSSGPYGYMSNLYQRPFTFEGRTFRSREDAYQYGKPDDMKIAEWLIASPAPRLTAMAGRALGKYDYRPNFHALKVERMTRINRAFFQQHRDLAEQLAATWPAELEEASPTDAFWGTGPNGAGANVQGQILMQIREEGRGSPEATPKTPDRPRRRARRKQEDPT